MTLPAAAPARQLKHRRTLDVQIYARGDGLWDVDATLVDTKTRDALLAGKPRPAGTPIHDMLLRIVVDRRLNIVDAGAETRWMPYEGICDDHGDVYKRLVGLNLLQGFRRAVLERVGGVKGCTHITELAQVLPTAVIQGLVGEAIDVQGADDRQPFQIDRCHALQSSGEAVRLHYPRWYRAPEPASTEPIAEERE